MSRGVCVFHTGFSCVDIVDMLHKDVTAEKKASANLFARFQTVVWRLMTRRNNLSTLLHRLIEVFYT